MSCIINETRLLFCDIYDKSISFSSRLRHVNSKFHKHEEENGTDVKDYELIGPEIDVVIFILNDILKNVEIFFHSFEYRCVYDFKFISMENFSEIILTIFIGHMKIKSHFYGLTKKSEKRWKLDLNLVK